MLNPEQLQQFRSDGYAIAPALFSADEIDAVTTRIDAYDAARELELAQKAQGTQGISRKGEISFNADLARRDRTIMAFFSSLAFHKSGPNLSKNTRKGYIVQYSAARTRTLSDGKIAGKQVLTLEGRLV